VDPVLLQAVVVVPLIVGLAARIVLRPRNAPVHWLLAGLLGSMAGWITANALSQLTAGTAWGAGGVPALLWGCPLTVLYLLTLAFQARVAVFESLRVCLAVAAPFVPLALLIATNSWHRLVFKMPPDPLLPLSAWAGPGFWAFQLWSYAYMLTGLSFAVLRVLPPSSPGERRRMGLIVAASLVPLAAHTLTLLEWLPLDYPVTPGAMGVSALLIVVAIDRYGLLEAQPLVQRDVMEELHDGVLLADADGAVIDVNRAGERLLGERRDALRGRGLSDVLLGLARPEENPALAERWRDAGGFEAELRTADGRHLEVRSGAVRAFAQQPAGRFLVIRDRTEERHRERLLQQRQRLESVGVLAAGVAHEVNNPLAFVRANLAHLEQLAAQLPKLAGADGREVAPEVLEMADVVAESVQGLDRIARIVESLLRFARPPVDELRSVSLSLVAEHALRFAALHRGSPLRVETELAPALPAIEGSEDRLVQVVLNLLLNARQALVGRSDGWIRVETVAEGASVVLRVRDNGPGVPAAIRERIFDPFFTTRGPGEGTGLGLAIAYDIVREHEGTLELEAQPGGGACFALRLRRHAAA
jgi:PAS domain S-box-containing protein